MLESSIFVSEDVDSQDAANEIVEQIKKDGRKPAAILLFAGIDHEHQAVIDTFYESFPNIVLCGGTTDGEMSGGDFRHDSLTACCFWETADVQYDVVGIENVDNGAIPAQVEAALAKKIAGLKLPLKLVIQISNGLTVNSGGIMAAANPMITKAGGLLVGGASGDRFRFKKTIEFINKKAVTNSASFMLISGNVKVHHSTEGGWKPVGEFHTVTKSNFNVVQEIDGKPVLDFYKEVLGVDKNLDNAMFMQAVAPFPLAIYDSEGSFSLRTPLMRTPENHIMYAGEIPVGAKMKYTKVNKEDLLSAIGVCAENCKSKSGFKPRLAIIFSCTTRLQFLGTEINREVANFKKVIGDDVNLVGFYAYGEMAPHPGKKECILHNNTLTATILG